MPLQQGETHDRTHLLLRHTTVILSVVHVLMLYLQQEPRWSLACTDAVAGEPSAFVAKAREVLAAFSNLTSVIGRFISLPF